MALLSNNQLIAVSKYDEPRPRLLAPCPEGEVSSWSLIPPAHTLSRSVEVLLAVDKTVYLVDSTEAEDKILQDGPFKHVTVSPTGRFVALFTGKESCGLSATTSRTNSANMTRNLVLRPVV